MGAPHDHMTLSMPSDPQYLCAIRAFFSSLCNDLGFDKQEVNSIVLAIHEACTNVIKHCYHGDCEQRIDFTVHITPEHFTVDIQDYGGQQDVTRIVPRALEHVRPGGLGTHFIQSVMDDVTYNSSEAGTVLRMTKRRGVSCKSE
jgi:anti-sigma regulatory factor (Ser/Thr protein kinase)